MRNEFFKILRNAKKFNRATKSFHINISYKTAAKTTPRTLAVSEAFGLGARLVRETLRLAGTCCVEAVAVMAKYNPFFEKAGMTRLAVQSPNPSCAEAIQRLGKLGFNSHLLASEKYNKEKLGKLDKNQTEECKAILATARNHRLRRTFANQPYINNKTFKTAIENANVSKLAKALHVLNILLQMKVYLFWTRSEQ